MPAGVMDKTQVGRAGELALALYALISSDGELELFTPIADDDHVDATAGRRGGIPAIAIQVKTAPKVDRDGLVEARASFPVGQVREHPAFLYAVLLLDSVAIGSAWLVPSPDFNRLVYRQAAPGRVVLAFRGHPKRPDPFTPFLVPPLELGPRLLSIIDSLQEPIPRELLGLGPGLLVANHRSR
jgi:hypothetical protein